MKKLKNKNTKHKTMKHKNHKIKKAIASSYNGGAAFAHGGYGCLFKPALKCQDSETPKNYISKLIVKKNAEREYKYISDIKKKIEGLPESIKKYFLLDNIKMCNPKPLTEEDKVKMEDICKNNLAKAKNTAGDESLTAENINNYLYKFKIINMPELGIDLSTYIKKTKFVPGDLVNINNIIIDYITNIIPSLYKNGVIHGDIKSNNMMFSLTDTDTPILIDWGLSYITNHDKETVPAALYDLAVQWHHPFTTYLFDKELQEEYHAFLQNLKTDGIKLTKNSIRSFVISSYMNFIDDHDNQFRVLYETFYTVFRDDFTKYLKKEDSDVSDKLIVNNLVIYYIVEYIIDVLITYTVNNKLDMVKYFNDVYLMNVDTWGILSLYTDIIDRPKTMFALSDKEYKIFITKAMYILIENVYTNGSKPINIQKLVEDIRKLNEFLNSAKNNKNNIQATDLDKLVVDKKLSGNKLFFENIEKKSIKKKHSFNAPLFNVSMIKGGYRTRKNIKK